MISTDQLLGYAVASFVLIVVPGPGVLFVVGRALAHGRRTAITTAVGHAGGSYVVAAFLAVGLGTLLERSAQVFVAVKLAGALYLVLLGAQAVRRRGELASAMPDAVPARPRRRRPRDDRPRRHGGAHRPEGLNFRSRPCISRAESRNMRKSRAGGLVILAADAARGVVLWADGEIGR